MPFIDPFYHTRKIRKGVFRPQCALHKTAKEPLLLRAHQLLQALSSLHPQGLPFRGIPQSNHQPGGGVQPCNLPELLVVDPPQNAAVPTPEPWLPRSDRAAAMPISMEAVVVVLHFRPQAGGLAVGLLGNHNEHRCLGRKLIHPHPLAGLAGGLCRLPFATVRW